MTGFWLVALGALVGAPARYLLDLAAKARLGAAFPWGTFLVNALGSFVLGAVLGAAPLLGPDLVLLLGVGFCGAFTTYSTFAHDALTLAERPARARAGVYVIATVALGVAAAALGVAVGGALAGP